MITPPYFYKICVLTMGSTIFISDFVPRLIFLYLVLLTCFEFFYLHYLYSIPLFQNLVILFRLIFYDMQQFHVSHHRHQIQQILLADILTILDAYTFHTNTSRYHNYFVPALIAVVSLSLLNLLFLFQLGNRDKHHLIFFAALVSSLLLFEYDDRD